MTSPSERLRIYASTHPAERTLALIAARWLAAEPTAVHDPLLADLWENVRLSEAVSDIDTLPFDLMMAKVSPAVATKKVSEPTKRSNVGPRSITDYFALAGPTEEPVVTTKTALAPLTIYCDGACSANGRRGAKAGFGVSVWSPEGVEVDAVSVRLPTNEPQTNQRAELRGLAEALHRATQSSGGADIYTDSQYAINCLQTWGAGWAAKGWRKADGGAVLHQDILRPMWELWKRRGPHIHLYHVAAHTGRTDRHSRGNARADALATKSIEGASP